MPGSMLRMKWGGPWQLAHADVPVEAGGQEENPPAETARGCGGRDAVLPDSRGGGGCVAVRGQSRDGGGVPGGFVRRP